MFRKAALICMVAGLVLVPAMVFQAHAAMMSYFVTFSASGFSTGAPEDPVTGSFTITFDPTLPATNQTSGISLNSLNISLDSAFAFDYEPGPPADLVVGGDQNGVSAVSANTNDFFLIISSFTTGPYFEQFNYSQVGENEVFSAIPPIAGSEITGTVSAVPLPPAVLLLSAGLIRLACWRRRKQSGE